MKISDLISMCARNLTRRKFRTFLTVMGVVIGTSFIVLMISLGIAISENNQAMLESRGDLTMINIYNRGNTEFPLDDDALARINALPGVSMATTIVRFYDQVQNGWGSLYAGRKDRYNNGYYGIVCMDPAAMDAMGFELLEGEPLTADPGPQNPNKRVIRVLAASKFAYSFYDTKKHWSNNMVEYWNVPEGEELPDPFFDMMTTDIFLQMEPQKENGKVLRVQLEVVGIAAENWNMDFYEDGCIMSLEDMQWIVEQYNKLNNIKKDTTTATGYNNAYVKCLSIDDVAEVEQAIHDMGFMNTQSMEQERQSAVEFAERLQMILGIVGGVALFIAALSIINTMIMSVYERTREIGVMKVLGCVLGDIRKVFLVEAALIGLMGGIIGDGLSYLASYLFNKYGGSLSELLGMETGGGYYYGAEEVVQKISVIPPWLLLLGLLFATCVGLVSGIIPAMRAVKISALEAIRTE